MWLFRVRNLHKILAQNFYKNLFILLLYVKVIFFQNLLSSENLSLYETFGRFVGELLFFRENEFALHCTPGLLTYSKIRIT